MYMYDRELGEPPAPVNPAGHQSEVCPMLKDRKGSFLSHQDYLTRAFDKKNPLSRFKVMRTVESYDSFVDSCKKDVIAEILKSMPWLPRLFRPPLPVKPKGPRDPKNPTDLKMR